MKAQSMRKLIILSAAVLTAAVILVAGYQLGARGWPGAPSPLANTSAGMSTRGTLAASTGRERKVLYWKDPDGKADYSAAPRKASNGRDYLPVYDDEEPDFDGAGPRKEASAPKAKGERKIIHYRNPMGLPDISKVPKKDPMGMDYIPVYEGEEEESSTVKVSLDRVQRAGVRTEPAELRAIVRPVRAPGVAKLDERTLKVVSLRADGFIEALYVNETGKQVEAGQPLFRIYSPQMVSVQVDYRTAMTSAGRAVGGEQGALQRLRNLAVPEQVIRNLRTNPSPNLSIDWPAPITGVVIKKMAVEGMMMKAGEELYRLADLTSIWVIADVAEQDLGLVKIGATARVTFRAFPDQPYEGRVTFILPELEMGTRTAKVRIEVKNSDYRIKQEMFADVEIEAGTGDEPRLTVPVSAVLDSGNRQVVLVDRGEGRFEPRQVKLGLRGDNFVEIREGVQAGEKVVIAANFLIDAESNLKAALQGFTADDQKAKAEGKP